MQEEILLMITPECLPGLVFCPRMLDNESIIIRGAERFSNYSGYATTFEFAGNYIDARKLYRLFF